ncbi:MAG: hypothetical protein HKP12_14965 [Gammaproteobacteria bacterium]|nr:hypothetical protein [Gammaproteobacteria bacterium]
MLKAQDDLAAMGFQLRSIGDVVNLCIVFDSINDIINARLYDRVQAKQQAYIGQSSTEQV